MRHSDRTILSRPYIDALNEIERQFRGSPVTIAQSPQARSRANRKWNDSKRSAERQAELNEQDRIDEAVHSLSPRAKACWDRILTGKWYKPHDAKTPKAIQELVDKGLIRVGGSPMVIAARYMPIFSQMFTPEFIPEAMPRG